MKKHPALSAALAAVSLAACAAPAHESPITGGDRDAHGCIGSAGQTWSYLKQQCVQTFNIADIRLSETRNGTEYSIDIILSADRRRAEVFAVGLPENTILSQTANGYASADGKIRLLRQARGWKLEK